MGACRVDLGGTIGCYEFLVGGYPSDIKTGQRFALFINAKDPPLPTRADAPQVVQMWPVNGDAVTTAASVSSVRLSAFPLSTIQANWPSTRRTRSSGRPACWTPVENLGREGAG